MWQVYVAIGIVLGAFVIFIFCGIFFIIRDILSGNIKNRPQVIRIWHSLPYVIAIFLLILISTLVSIAVSVFGIIIWISEPSTAKTILIPLTIAGLWVFTGAVWYIFSYIYREYSQYSKSR